MRDGGGQHSFLNEAGHYSVMIERLAAAHHISSKKHPKPVALDVNGWHIGANQLCELRTSDEAHH